MAWTVECAECGTKEKFGDTKDIQFAKWQVLAWNVGTAEPIVICPECEYGKPKKKQTGDAKG